MAQVNLQRLQMFSVEGVVFGAEIGGGILVAEGIARMVKGFLQPQGIGETFVDVGTKAGVGIGLRMASGFFAGVTSDVLGVASWGAFAWALLSLVIALIPQVGSGLQRASSAGQSAQVDRSRSQRTLGEA